METKDHSAAWLTLMYAMQQHIRTRIAEGLLEQLRSAISEHEIEVGDYFALARPEIEKAFDIFGPGLLIDFLSYHPSLLAPGQLCKWAESYEPRD